MRDSQFHVYFSQCLRQVTIFYLTLLGHVLKILNFVKYTSHLSEWIKVGTNNTHIIRQKENFFMIKVDTYICISLINSKLPGCFQCFYKVTFGNNLSITGLSQVGPSKFYLPNFHTESGVLGYKPERQTWYLYGK